MEAALYKVVWTRRALKQLDALYNYIAQDSVREANKVADTLVSMTKKLPAHPLKHAADKFRKSKDGTYRAFTKFHYRVSYRILQEEEIRIVQIRHTSRKPRYY